MNYVKRTRLEEFRIKASILIKDLNSADNNKAEKAAERLLALPFLQYSSVLAILNDRSFFRKKHALMTIAIENGYADWNELRTNIIKEDCLFDNSSSSFLNVWFKNYDEAKEYQSIHGGYLLQYRKDHVICQQDYIDSLDLGDLQEEWEAIGYDWV